PFTRSSIFLPQSMYMDRMRNTGLVAQEFMYVGEFRQESWIFSGKFGVGKVHQDQKEILDVYLMPDYISGDFTNDRAWHAQIAADYDGGRIRLAYTGYAAPIRFKGAIGNYPIEANVGVKYQVLSAEYNALSWSLTSELFQATVSSDQMGYGEDTPQGGYLQASYRFENKWDGFLRYDYMVLDKNDRNGEAYQLSPAKNISGLPAFVRYAKDSAIGVGYHPNSDWVIRAELHNVQGTAWMTARDLKKGQKQTEYWDLIALAVSWRF
ncbi:MAG TPA: hypothetical protein VFM46_03970, partial [Pseudomonadales bacterium]|nr:hypothetical protein [Pseudomonadales bacterium]